MLYFGLNSFFYLIINLLYVNKSYFILAYFYLSPLRLAQAVDNYSTITGLLADPAIWRGLYERR